MVVGFALQTPLPVGEGPGVGERGNAARPAREVAHPLAIFPLKGDGSVVSRDGDGFGNADKDALGVVQDIIVPEPDHRVAIRFDGPSADDIGHVFGVLAAINLDYQLCLATGEIGDKWANRKLARELNAQLLASKSRPQPFFRLGRLAPQHPRNRRQAFCCHTSYTPTQPSPCRGRATFA